MVWHSFCCLEQLENGQSGSSAAAIVGKDNINGILQGHKRYYLWPLINIDLIFIIVPPLSG